MKKYKILSIDGGGVRGIIPARILQEIEEKTGKHIYQLFDMVVGTSTGALIALALTAPDCITSEFKYIGTYLPLTCCAKEIVDIYKKYSSDIFPKSFLHNIKCGFNLWGPKYERASYNEFLDTIFHNSLFKDAKCKVVIPSYDLITDKPIICKSWENFQGAYVKEIAAGATAAPTYFPPVELMYGTQTFLEQNEITQKITTYGLAFTESYSLIDGGIWANNPELIGASEALALNPELKREDICIVSIGTGRISLGNNASELQNAGIIGWLKSGLINMMMEAESDYTVDVVKQLYPNMVRLEPSLSHVMGVMDDTSETHINQLCDIAERYIQDNATVLDAVIKELD